MKLLANNRSIAVWLSCISLAAAVAHVHAQNCEPRDITLTTQAMVDSFQQVHGPCAVVGNLKVQGSDITNLRGLTGLTESSLNLWIIENPRLESLEGLDSLVSVRFDFHLIQNALLANVDALASLQSVNGKFRIEHNPNLRDLHGLSSLQLARFLYLNGNNSLKNLTGLGSLSDALVIEVIANASLISMAGLDSFTGYGPVLRTTVDLRIGNNPLLENLHGLENIAVLRELVLGNTAFVDLTGLSGLHSISDGLYIGSDHSITSLNGLDALEEVGEVRIVSTELTSLEALYRLENLDQLTIRSNRSLKALSGLASLTAVLGDISVLENPLLQDCSALTKVLNQTDEGDSGPGLPGMPDVGGDVLVGDNAEGCNCVLQVLQPGSGIFVLNPALTGAWFNPSNPGQGFFINLFADLDKIFVGWFTYEVEDRDTHAPTAVVGEPYHRWLTATGNWVGTKASLDVTSTSGGVFDSDEDVVNSPPESYGSVTVIFHSCDSATLSYNLYGVASGSTVIKRISPDNVARCMAWADYY